MPLCTLHLAENAISVDLAVEPVLALRREFALTDLDLSGNPLLGVEEGGRDEYTTRFVEALCGWLQDGVPLRTIMLVDVALCGLKRDGNGRTRRRICCSTRRSPRPTSACARST